MNVLTDKVVEQEGAAVIAGTMLPLMESFYTIQGEGFHQGKAAYFIRLAGCDVGCAWCDVKESWNASLYPLCNVNDLAEKAAGFRGKIVVVTGGEPLMHPLDKLCGVLHKKGFHIHLETSGSHPLSGCWDWICLSPKKFKPPLPGICKAANELKVIVYNKSDFKWAEKYAADVSSGCKLFLQPEWSKEDFMIPLIVDYIKVHPQWAISLQIHKYMKIP